MPPLTPIQFAAKWRHAELKERSAYQQHFLDLCALVGHPTPAELDPKGAFFTFEAGVSKVEGGEGFADVWYKGHFALEYKGKHANLDKAYQQLLQYRESLENPPLLVVCDIDRLVIHTNFTNTTKKVITLTFDDLLTADGIKQLHNLFYDPAAFRPAQTPSQVTEEAAKHFAKLADRLRDRGTPPEKSAHFLIQLLFSLFAEDVSLLPSDILTQMIARYKTKPENFNKSLADLFDKMSTGGLFGVEEILYFDGHLFENAETVPLNSDDLAILADVTFLDWATIQPSIFGTLFERSLDPSKRAQLGAHYTGEEDILCVIEPVLMAPLRREWVKIQEQARSLAAERDAATGKKRANLSDKLASLLMGFAQRLGTIRVLDAACGSGNFLYLALRRLLDLWKEVSLLSSELGLSMLTPSPGLAPSPTQLYGIEINEYAHQLAQATIWIGYIQWLRENGFGVPTEPILKPLDNIRQMDAILAWDENDKPYEPEWPKADVILGNPPFLGGNKIRTELGDRYVDALFSIYSDRIPPFSDLVCYWFEKAREMVSTYPQTRVGLLATQGIRGGQNRKVLDNIKKTGNIFWAFSDRNWILNGATVHVSMVGFDGGKEKNKCLDGTEVTEIYSNLTGGVDITKAKRLRENLDISFQGLSPKGPFDIQETLALEMISRPVNVNGRPNSDVVRPVVNAIDIVQRSRNMWTIDFGNVEEAEVPFYEIPFEHVKNVVFPIRVKNRIASRAEKWWRYADAGIGYRKAVENLRRFIGTPCVSKHRIFVWLYLPTLANNAINTFARDDDYFFGVLHSKLHELWARATGTQLREAESGFRYTPTSTFETFPFPWSPNKESAGDPRIEVIAQAARDLVQKRDAWLNPPGASEAELKKRTLTNLYNARPAWLDLAHRKLDQAVFAAYGWPDNLSDEEILEHLLQLNLERAANQESAK